MKHHLSIHSLALKLPLVIVFFCAVICTVNARIGYREFRTLFEWQYEKLCHQFAYIAQSYIDGDKIADYAAGAPADDDWNATTTMLEYLTELGEFAFISVTVLAPSPYESRTYVFNTVNKLLGTKYQAFSLGYVESLAKKDEAYRHRLARVIELDIGYSDYAYTTGGGHVTTAIPVHNADGKPVAILSVVKPLSEVLAMRERYLHATVIASLVFTVLFAVLALVWLMLRVLRPIMFITYETSHFARHNAALSGMLKKIKNKDELGVLAKAVEKMSEDMITYISDLTTMTAEKERLGAELNVATKIQSDGFVRN